MSIPPTTHPRVRGRENRPNGTQQVFVSGAQSSLLPGQAGQMAFLCGVIEGLLRLHGPLPPADEIAVRDKLKSILPVLVRDSILAGHCADTGETGPDQIPSRYLDPGWGGN